MNDLSIGTGQYAIDGPSIHGLIYRQGKLKGVNNYALSMNYDMTVPKLPGKLFIDFVTTQGNDFYFDFGFKKTFGPLLIILPLYHSWDAVKLTNSKEIFINRIRFSLSISNLGIRNLF